MQHLLLQAALAVVTAAVLLWLLLRPRRQQLWQVSSSNITSTTTAVVAVINGVPQRPHTRHSASTNLHCAAFWMRRSFPTSTPQTLASPTSPLDTIKTSLTSSQRRTRRSCSLLTDTCSLRSLLRTWRWHIKERRNSCHWLEKGLGNGIS